MKPLKILVVDKLDSSKLVIEELNRLGYEAIDFFDQPYVPGNRTIYDKFFNLFYRNILKNNRYYDEKSRRRFTKFCKKNILKIKKNHPKISYGIFFSPEWLSEDVLLISRGICQNMISYHYDGIFSRNKNMRTYNIYFDEMYSFDVRDIKNFPEYNLKPATNFWLKDIYTPQKAEFDLFYLGVGTPERINILNKLYKYCDANELEFKSLVTVNVLNNRHETSKIQFLTKAIPYIDNLDFIKRTSAIVDIKLSYHNGLSFRFFEAINYSKKIITNNKEIIKYDFFHPNNILVTDFHNLEQIANFLDLPYLEIAPEIKMKYSLENWIKYILNRGEFVKIELPT